MVNTRRGKEETRRKEIFFYQREGRKFRSVGKEKEEGGRLFPRVGKVGFYMLFFRTLLRSNSFLQVLNFF